MLTHENLGDKFLAIASMGMIVSSAVTCFLSVDMGLSFVALGVVVLPEI